jgi:hypothetical protein
MITQDYYFNDSIFNANPFFILSDNSYYTIMNKLIKSSKIQYTYIVDCKHSNKDSCPCPKYRNILYNGKLFFEYRGRKKLVISKTKFLNNIETLMG